MEDYPEEELYKICQNALNRENDHLIACEATRERYKIWLETGVSTGVGAAHHVQR